MLSLSFSSAAFEIKPCETAAHLDDATLKAALLDTDKVVLRANEPQNGSRDCFIISREAIQRSIVLSDAVKETTKNEKEVEKNIVNVMGDSSALEDIARLLDEVPPKVSDGRAKIEIEEQLKEEEASDLIPFIKLADYLLSDILVTPAIKILAKRVISRASTRALDRLDDGYLAGVESWGRGLKRKLGTQLVDEARGMRGTIKMAILTLIQDHPEVSAVFERVFTRWD